MVISHLLSYFRGTTWSFRTIRWDRKYKCKNGPEYWKIKRICFYRLQQRGSHWQGCRCRWTRYQQQKSRSQKGESATWKNIRWWTYQWTFWWWHQELFWPIRHCKFTRSYIPFKNKHLVCYRSSKLRCLLTKLKIKGKDSVLLHLSQSRWLTNYWRPLNRPSKIKR